MAKELEFRLGDHLLSLSPTKLERKKLYGWAEMRATTPDGALCNQAGIDISGKIIIPKGATKIGMVGKDGLWLEKESLVAVHADGTPAEPITSSFDTTINLVEKATIEDLLDLRVSAVYQLSGEDCEELKGLLGGDIYTFPFSYRGGYETSMAFLLSNGSVVYIITGEKIVFDYVGLDEQGVLTECEEVDIEEDEFDFSMM